MPQSTLEMPRRTEAAAPAESAGRPRRNLASRVARWSIAHRRIAIGGWLGLVALVFVLGSVVGVRSLEADEVGTGESGRALAMLARAGFERPAEEAVLVQGSRPRAGDPAFRAAVRDVVARLSALPGVTQVRSPYAAGNRGQLSRDGRSALVLFELAGKAKGAQKRVGPSLDAVAAAQRAHPGLRIEQVGDASMGRAMSRSIDRDFERAGLVSIPLTLAVLLLVFGALTAAAVPVLLALSCVVAATGALAFASLVWPAEEAVNAVILGIGLAVGVDYSLFYIRREREERAAGRSPEQALERAAATSGRAILVSGLTVLIAMSGMFVTGDEVFASMGVGAMLVVAFAIVGSLTVLPALLSTLGDRIERLRMPFQRPVRPLDAATGNGLLGRVLGLALRRPAVSVVAVGGLLALLGVPAFSIHTVEPGPSGLPQGLAVKKTYDRVQKAFPGGPQPAQVVVRAADVRTPAVVRGIERLRTAALASGVMQNPIAVAGSPDRTVARVSIPLAGTGTDALSNRALGVLRTQAIPATIGSVDGVEVAVTGMTANSADDNAQLKARAPYVFVFVLGLACVLLLAAFRSLAIALASILLNLLSVGAAYGLLVACFQWGWGESILGFESIGGVVSWLPLFLFVVLFGLSMDYHVFIVSRIREAHDRGLDTEEAISRGISSSASVVTSAAVIMVGVFSIFALLSVVEMKQLGVGLAAAILIDATLVRTILLPATMKLLGRWNWVMPRLRRAGA